MSLFLVVILIFSPVVLGLIALFVWGRWFRPKIGEPPVKELMLRSAGESSRRKIAALNDKMSEDIAFVSLVPALMALLYYQQHSLLGRDAGPDWWMPLLLSSVAVCWKGGVIVRRLMELRNRELGCAGERLVAERLASLAQHSYLIFHDCPADVHGNIDHIVVTPAAVYAIETKTRRKRPSTDPERSPAEVIYDGRSLNFPWGREDFGLDQARRQACWLSDLLGKALAESVEVQAVLALPGWMVRRKGRGNVAVVNPKELSSLIRERNPVPPTSHATRRMQQIEFVLDGRCRDVAFGSNSDTADVEVGKKAKPHRSGRPRYAATER